MLRPTLLTLSLALLAGCSPSATPPAANAPHVDLGPGSAKPAEQELVVKEVVILGVTPGKTTLEEFKKRFHVAEVKETTAQGVVTADAGPGAVLEGDGMKFDRLTGAFLDGVLIDIAARSPADGVATKALEASFGPGETGNSGARKWKFGDLSVVYFEEFGTLQVFSAAGGLTSFDRGFPGLAGHQWAD